MVFMRRLPVCRFELHTNLFFMSVIEDVLSLGRIDLTLTNFNRIQRHENGFVFALKMIHWLIL